ncbi:hypothetical protein ABZ318_24375 [Streptomyces sp. NPDC006197]|uniref:hypothetical protein n=1 Tax=Streptomyces sp. NPDC006197 TaxID=3156685 RepID=UPI0033AD5B32
MKLALRDASSHTITIVDPARGGVTASVTSAGRFSADTDVLLRIQARLDPHAEVYSLLDQLDDTLPEERIRQCADELGTALLRLGDLAQKQGEPPDALSSLLELASEPLPVARGLAAWMGRRPSARGLATRRAAALMSLLERIDP